MGNAARNILPKKVNVNLRCACVWRMRIDQDDLESPRADPDDQQSRLSSNDGIIIFSEVDWLTLYPAVGMNFGKTYDLSAYHNAPALWRHC